MPTGSIIVNLRDSVFEPSNAMLHLANLLVYIRQHWRDDALQRRVQWQERTQAEMDAIMQWLKRDEDEVVLELAEQENEMSYQDMCDAKLAEHTRFLEPHAGTQRGQALAHCLCLQHPLPNARVGRHALLWAERLIDGRCCGRCGCLGVLAALARVGPRTFHRRQPLLRRQGRGGAGYRKVVLLP